MNFQKLVHGVLKPMRCGKLVVGLPDGGEWRIGGLSPEPSARVDVRDGNFFRRVVLFGPIGFGESYVAGEWETPDLSAVIAFFIANAEESAAMETTGGRRKSGIDFFALANRLAHLARPNSLETSRRNISEHYDLSNEFFALWLDPTMTYSSALFETADLTLEEAQLRKYEALGRGLRLGPDDHVLEIGTGWGGFSIHAAKTFGCRVTTTTISLRQHAEAVARVEAAGLSGRVSVLLEDYRNLRGRFDKVVSIEMIEAVGDAYVDGYFQKIEDLLQPDGLAGIQAILCPDQQYEILRRGVDFIQKHIFPGSLLMSTGRILDATGRTRNLNLFKYDDMAPHYAKTLRLWREAFEARLDDVRELGFDDAFIRKWRYYLSYCEAAFAMRFISVAQLIFTKTGNLGLNAGSPVDGFPWARRP